MAQVLGVSIEGLSALNKALRKSGADLSELKALNLEAVQTVLPYVNSMVPLGIEDPGALLASVRGSATAAGAYIRVGSRSVPYAGVIEWGYPAGGKKDLSGRHYLTDALNQAEPAWIDIYFEKLEDILKKIADATNSAGD